MLVGKQITCVYAATPTATARAIAKARTPVIPPLEKLILPDEEALEVVLAGEAEPVVVGLEVIEALMEEVTETADLVVEAVAVALELVEFEGAAAIR